MHAPTCDTKKCFRKGKKLYVYSDGILTIGICYSCGMFDGIDSDPKILQEVVGQPELILDLIKSGHLTSIN